MLPSNFFHEQGRVSQKTAVFTCPGFLLGVLIAIAPQAASAGEDTKPRNLIVVETVAKRPHCRTTKP